MSEYLTLLSVAVDSVAQHYAPMRAKTAECIPSFPFDKIDRLVRIAELLQGLLDGCLESYGVRRVESKPVAVTAWSRPSTKMHWAKVFGWHRNTVAKKLKEQDPRNKGAGRSIQIAIDDLPEEYKRKRQDEGLPV